TKSDFKTGSKPSTGPRSAAGVKPAAKSIAGSEFKPRDGKSKSEPEFKPRAAKSNAGSEFKPRPAKSNARSEFKPWAGKSKAEPASGDENLIIGRNPVMEALKSGREIDKLLILRDAEGSIRKLIGMAKDKNLLCQFVEKTALDRIAGGKVHQGVIAFISNFEYCEPEDILEKARRNGEAPFIIILDGIEDPHNLGAIMRTADGAGAHGIIIPKRRAAGITDVVAKASAGAVEYVAVARVSNIAQAIDRLKEAGVWIAACDMDGTEYDSAELKGSLALVIGAEGQGVSRLVKEKCDYILSIPMSGKIASLNASNAAAILMYEVKRQRKG
ncbi:MAG TPA: 23S rRNA (guanosine(2251)-2'-O)-methyltransferase RlmB, partial [Anaerovoracaceae bacterium]|nr:23S rRNA (guanosine(2251)-2'-O)-methyltransferase RlmB [Anaerovoracaceae bacterium]